MLKAIVTGCGRSGTTMMINLLGQHSKIAPLYEVEFFQTIFSGIYDQTLELVNALAVMCEWAACDGGLPFLNVVNTEQAPHKFGNKYCRVGMVDFINMAIKYTIDLGHGNVKGTKEFLDKFCDLHEEKGEDTIIKNPSFILFWEILLRDYPALKVVHMIRDGRDVFASIKDQPWGSKEPADHATAWNEYQTAIMDVPEENRIIVKYEDFCLNPDMKPIWEFLGLKEEKVDFSPRPVIKRYERDLSKEEIGIYESVANLKEWGYK